MKNRARWSRSITAVGVLTIALTIVGAAPLRARSADGPGVTNKTVKIGFISSETGAGAVVGDAAKACQARIDAQNASGGVNGRKIDLVAVDDKTADNLTPAKNLVENEHVFAVINSSAVGFMSYRYLKDAGVPQIGSGADGTYYGEKGNESIFSPLGNTAPVAGLGYDYIERMMKSMGAKKVGAVGYAISPGSKNAATNAVKYGAPAVGLQSGYLNTAVDYGSTDVGSIVLGVKNSGSDALYLPLLASTNFSVVQGLQQNNVPMKSIVLATGYTQELLDQPIAKTIQPNTVFMTANRPIELGGPAVKKFTKTLKKYANVTGVPDYGTYGGYITCDMLIQGLQRAGKTLTRQAFVDGLHKIGEYDGAGLACKPIDISLENFGKSSPTGCGWMVGVKNGKFVVLNHGKPLTGKLIGEPGTVAQAIAGTNSTATTTTQTP